MKKLYTLLAVLLVLIGVHGFFNEAYAIPPTPLFRLPSSCSNGQVVVYNSTTGKWDTCASLSGGDMLEAVYTTTGKIKTSVGGTGIDSSGSTGTAYVTAGTWSVANAATMRTNLGLVIGTNVQAWDADLDTYAGITPSADVQTMLGSANNAEIQTNVGLAIGTDVQAYDADLTTYAGITPSANTQTFLGADDYAAMRTQLGLVIGTNVQAYDADLTTYAGITPSANIQSFLGSADYATARTNLGVAIGTDVQAYDADLTTYAGITPSANVQTLLGAADYATARATLEVYSKTEVDTKAQTTAISEARGMMEFINLSLVASVSAKALTIAVKGRDGENPSATNKVIIPFRSATATSGLITAREVTSALSITLSAGSTLGFTAATAGRLYVWAIDNAGTVELALSRTADIFPESNLISTTAEGGAGAADSATVMYSTTARSNLACRCIGYIEITTGATAGEWDNAPTKVQVMGPGVKRTGDIVQTVVTIDGEYATGSTAVTFDDTIPQKTEGNEFMTRAITPTSAINLLRIEATANVSPSNTQSMLMALFQDDGADALAVTAWAEDNTRLQAITLWHQMVSGTTSATTFKIRVGGQSTIYFNGVSGARVFGGVSASSLRVTEVFA